MSNQLTPPDEDCQAGPSAEELLETRAKLDALLGLNQAPPESYAEVFGERRREESKLCDCVWCETSRIIKGTP